MMAKRKANETSLNFLLTNTHVTFHGNNYTVPSVEHVSIFPSSFFVRHDE